jgi:hypothetical protein
MARVGIAKSFQKSGAPLRERPFKNHHQWEKEEKEKKCQRRTDK